jgi:Acyl-CoA synthetases (AMP-forming)/AMP-acid ligases II
MRPPLGRTIPDVLREQCATNPEALAVISERGDLSFEALLQSGARVAGALRQRGIRRGDRVGILMPNRPEWFEAFVGIAMSGAIAVPLSTWSTRQELDFLYRDSGIVFLFTLAQFGGRDFASDAAAILADHPELPLTPASVVVVDGDAGAFVAWRDFLTEAQPLSPLAPGDGPSAPDDALVLYTSGSTSWPKGVRLQHFGMVENGYNIGECQGLVPGDRVFLSAPLFWSYGAANAMPAAFTHGAALVLAERFEPGHALDTIERTGCNSIYTLPTMTAALVAHPEFRRERVATLRTGLTIGGPKDFLTGVEDMGITELCNIYGATETYGNCVVTPHHWSIERRTHSQGIPLPGQKLRLVDPETGHEVAPGEAGEVEVTGIISPGYTGISAQLNAKAFTPDGYYRTGDRARINENGDFVFVGRDSEMIKRAGINVSPTEVEDILLQADGVDSAAVVGVTDTARGELIVAFVIPRPGDRLVPDQLVAHCRNVASKYKTPDRIVVTDAFPQTATGKVLKRDLKARAEALIGAQGEVAT